MIDNPFRAILPRYSGWLVWLFGRLRLTPNGVTLLALAVALVAAFFCAQGYAWAAIAAWWLGRLLDGTDGIYARASGQTSDFGAYLDIVCDMTAYSAMVLAFFVARPDLSSSWLIILFLYVLCIASALALGMLEQKQDLAVRDNRGLRLGAGLAEGGETGLAYTLFLACPALLAELTYLWIAILSVTVLARSVLARQLLGKVTKI